MKNLCKVLMPEQVSRIVANFDLLSFIDCSLTMFDASLRIAFAERWHKETSSFHLLFGEMSIILDDVSFLFHLSIVDRFSTALVINQKLACITVVQDLGVTKKVMLEEFDFNKGAHFWMSWLLDKYMELVEGHM